MIKYPNKTRDQVSKKAVIMYVNKNSNKKIRYGHTDQCKISEKYTSKHADNKSEYFQTFIGEKKSIFTYHLNSLTPANHKYIEFQCKPY